MNIEIQESLFKKNCIALFLLLLGQPFLGQGLDALFQNPGRKVGRITGRNISKEALVRYRDIDPRGAPIAGVRQSDRTEFDLFLGQRTTYK